jgi:glycosyltransferase involved in cell wall biosynthesis
MKIVQLMTVMEAGGVQRVAYLLAESLKSKGHSAEPWFLYRKRSAYENVAGTKVFMERQPKATDLPGLWMSVKRALACARPDVVITHTYYSNVIGQSAALASGVPTRIAVQHNPSHSYPTMARLVDKLCGSLPIYGVNVAVSKAVIQSLHGYPDSYQKKVRLVYNGIPSPPPGRARNEVRAQFGLPCDRPLIANVGRLADQKQQGILLRALVELPEVHLALVGDGELREQLAAEAKQLDVAARVHFLGEIPVETAHEVISSSEVFAFPSKFEAMPIALLEAMCMGVPIVASDIPANREVLVNAGSLIASGDPGEYARAIRGILEDATLSARYVALARARSSQFQLQTMVTGYEQLFGKEERVAKSNAPAAQIHPSAAPPSINTIDRQIETP